MESTSSNARFALNDLMPSPEGRKMDGYGDGEWIRAQAVRYYARRAIPPSVANSLVIERGGDAGEKYVSSR